MAAVVARRLRGVEHQIHQHLAELRPVSQHRWHRPGRERQLCAPTDGRLEQRRHLADDRRQIRRRSLGPTLAGVGQQLPAEVRRLVRRGLDRAEELVPALFDELWTAPQQLRIAADDHQEIVEVVGDATGQHPQALEALDVLELRDHATSLFVALPARLLRVLGLGDGRGQDHRHGPQGEDVGPEEKEVVAEARRHEGIGALRRADHGARARDEAADHRTAGPEAQADPDDEGKGQERQEQGLPRNAQRASEGEPDQPREHQQRRPRFAIADQRAPARSAADAHQDQRSDDRGTAGVTEPPDRPDAAEALPAERAAEVEAAHADGGAHRGAQQHPEEEEGEHVSEPSEAGVEVRHAGQQEPTHEGLEGVSDGDGHQRTGWRTDARVGDRRAEEHPRPQARPQQHQRRQREAGGGPDEGGVLLRLRQQQAEAPGHRVERGEPEDESAIAERGEASPSCAPDRGGGHERGRLIIGGVSRHSPGMGPMRRCE